MMTRAEPPPVPARSGASQFALWASAVSANIQKSPAFAPGKAGLFFDSQH